MDGIFQHEYFEIILGKDILNTVTNRRREFLAEICGKLGRQISDDASVSWNL
jgi:hypothetical protein